MNSAEIHYQVPWRSSSNFPGHHASQQQGGGLQFRHHAPLLNAPDPRRFDVHASLRDPFEQTQVRVYRRTGSIAVYVVADLSASMAYIGVTAKMNTLAELVTGLSNSVYRTGDRFGFVGCAEQHAEPLLLPPTLNRAAVVELAEQLRRWQPQGSNSTGLHQAAELIGPRRALVFLVSDFHLPLALIEDTLGSLAHHDVVPTVVWDRHEYAQLPRYGLARVTDRETGQSRMLMLRPSLRARIEQEFVRRRERLVELCGRLGRRPLMMEDGFDADEVTHYFFG